MGQTPTQWGMDGEGFKIKVVEKSGTSVKCKLQRSDISGQRDCDAEDCVVCTTSGSGNCRQESVGYEITCLECERMGVRTAYLGETGRTASIRCKEHVDNVAKRKGSLWPHCLEEHSGLVPQFKCSVVGRFSNPLDRQLDEAMRIR